MSSGNEKTDNHRIGPVFENMVRICESHLDTFGHVNNAAYLQILEDVRWDIITDRGYGLDTINEKKVGPVVLGVSLQFRKEILNREVIQVRSWTTAVKGKISMFRQVMINARGEEACVADFTFGLFDMAQRKLIEPTPEWKKALALDT